MCVHRTVTLVLSFITILCCHVGRILKLMKQFRAFRNVSLQVKVGSFRLIVATCSDYQYQRCLKKWYLCIFVFFPTGFTLLKDSKTFLSRVVCSKCWRGIGCHFLISSVFIYLFNNHHICKLINQAFKSMRIYCTWRLKI